jgi:DNA ligase (NAD+)
VGDQVIVRRAGDVIPEVVGRVPGKRPAYAQLPHAQDLSICGSEVVREKSEANHRCTGGLFCGAQRKEAILHFSPPCHGHRRSGRQAGRSAVDAKVVRVLPTFTGWA